MTEDRIAPSGKIWVCMACGKTCRDLYGNDNPLWDASCVVNSVLVEVDKLIFENGLVIEILD